MLVELSGRLGERMAVNLQRRVGGVNCIPISDGSKTINWQPVYENLRDNPDVVTVCDFDGVIKQPFAKTGWLTLAKICKLSKDVVLWTSRIDIQTDHESMIVPTISRGLISRLEGMFSNLKVVTGKSTGGKNILDLLTQSGQTVYIGSSFFDRRKVQLFADRATDEQKQRLTYFDTSHVIV